ncbi:MAG TPA: AgmX/PglI C-terminal domain-containing protein [Polyangia bacterium]|jgi:hypothetical protein
MPREKVLRIGIVQNGRIVEERLVRERGPVSVGQSARSTFVVPSESLPRSLVLFEATAAGYVLNAAPGLQGRVSVGDTVVALGDLARRGGGRVALGEAARGKVVAGDTTILFQLVTPPAPQPRPRLPAAVRGGLGSQIDRVMAGVLGSSLAVHLAFFLYALVFVEIPRNPTIEEEFANLPRAIRVQVQPPEPRRAPGGAGTGPAPAAAAAPARRRIATPAPRRPLTVGEQAARDAERRAHARDAAAHVGIIALVSKGPGGGRSAFADAMKDGGATADLDRVIKGKRVALGAGPDPLGISSRGTGPSHDGITGASGLDGATAGPVGDSGLGRAQRRERRIVIDRPRIDDDTVKGDADPKEVGKTINRGYAAIKACYDRGLKHNAKLGGKLTVRITITGAGSVGRIAVEQNTLRAPDVVGCMENAMRGWRFPPVRGGRTAAVEPTWVFKTAD